MKPQIIEATQDDLPLIQNMWLFYIYELGRYCGFNKGWECPVNLNFIPDDLTFYFTNPNQAFLINVGGEVAGFILLNKKGTQLSIDWNMAEFFILAKFQGKGIGQSIAHELWKTHSGCWEVSVIPENKPALAFWRKAVSVFTKSSYTEKLMEIDYDKSQSERIILSFDTRNEFSAPTFKGHDNVKIIFVDSLSDELKQRMSEGFESYEVSHGIDINYKRFSVVLYNANDVACGVINAYTAFAEIYIDDIWVDSDHRGKGYGTKLLQALEAHFKGQGFNNINLCTSAFQAPEFYKKCGFYPEFTRENKINSKLSKTFFVKFFEEENQNQGLLNHSGRV
ncbi:GNAT family N-acetyltransferase [Legionella rowbothamii]|uniref:GNAT family N-acetyltransferase n=1 Tax=Legionella rowbothamii TaxID=96229 RepID=UPI001056A511|nr:GNAT family N-acetyltransferase [Legionella rowbothamii]